MVNYNIVTFCRICRERLVSNKSEERKIFCYKCKKIANTNREEYK